MYMLMMSKLAESYLKTFVLPMFTNRDSKSSVGFRGDLWNKSGKVTVENRDHKITSILRCLYVELMFMLLIFSQIDRFVVCHLLLYQTVIVVVSLLGCTCEIHPSKTFWKRFIYNSSPCQLHMFPVTVISATTM